MRTIAVLWTPAQDAILEDLAAAGPVSVSRAAAALHAAGYPPRTDRGISERCYVLGLRTAGQPGHWQEAEIAILHAALIADPQVSLTTLRAALAAAGFRRAFSSIDTKRAGLLAALTSVSPAARRRAAIARDAKLFASVITRVCPLGQGAAA